MNKQFELMCLNIAKAREKLNMSTHDLSLQIFKDKSYISKLESGKINVSLKTLLQICEVLKIDITELFINK